MEINFIANEIVYEVTEYNSYLVGFADDKNEPKEYVIVERALEDWNFLGILCSGKC